MSHLAVATELYQQWENKQISDFMLIKKQREIINELSDEIIRLKTENAELDEKQECEIYVINLFTEARDKYHNFFMSRDRVSMMEQIEHDDVMKHYNFSIEFLKSYNEVDL